MLSTYTLSGPGRSVKIVFNRQFYLSLPSVQNSNLCIFDKHITSLRMLNNIKAN